MRAGKKEWWTPYWTLFLPNPDRRIRVATMAEGTARDASAPTRAAAKKAAAKVKRKKIVAKRFIKANLFLLPLLIVVPTAYQLTQPERAPLPYGATDQFDAQRHQIRQLTESQINIQFVVDEGIDTACVDSFLDAANTLHLDNINRVASSLRLSSRELNTFLKKSDRDIDSYFAAKSNDEGARQGEFTLIVVVLQQDEYSRLSQKTGKQIVLGEAPRLDFSAWQIPMRGIFSSKIQEIVTALRDYLQNPGQHLPRGVEVLYPSYHITLSLLLEKPSERSQLRWNEVESSGSISGLEHKRSRMRRLAKFLKLINEKIVRTFTRPHPTYGLYTNFTIPPRQLSL